MKISSSKFQVPRQFQIPIPRTNVALIRNLKLGAFLELGTWNLELSKLELGTWNLELSK
jgi:hypothetical protein